MCVEIQPEVDVVDANKFLHVGDTTTHVGDPLTDDITSYEDREPHTFRTINYRLTSLDKKITILQ